MNYRTRGNPAIAFFFLPLLLSAFCKTAEVSKKAAGRLDANIEQTYRDYNSLNGSFFIEGTISGKSFRYPGKIQFSQNISGKKFDLRIVVTDPVFLSPLTTILIDGQNLLYHDYINNRNETLPYDNSSLYFFSNYPVPARVIIPVILAKLPDNFLREGKRSKDGKSYRLTNSDYELTGFFTENKMHTLILNPSEAYNQIVFTFEGDMENNQNRFFPNKITMEFSKSDQIHVNFSKVLIE